MIKGGQLRVLAVMADERLPEYPDAPTLKELGYATARACGRRSTRPRRRRATCSRRCTRQTVQALNSEPVQDGFKKQMIKAVPNASIDDGEGLEQGRDRLLEEAHRGGEDRAAGVRRSMLPAPVDSSASCPTLSVHPRLFCLYEDAWMAGTSPG